MEKFEPRCHLPAYATIVARQEGIKPNKVTCFFAWACAALGRCIALYPPSPTIMTQSGEKQMDGFYTRLEKTIEVRTNGSHP